MSSKRIILATSALTAAAMANPLAAQEVSSSINITAGGSYETNPFLENGEDTGGFSTYVQVDPRITWEDETSVVSLNGGARYAYFPGQDRSNDSARLRLGGTTRASEKVDLNSFVLVQTSRSAGIDAILQDPSVLGDEGALPEIPIIDATIVGDRRRATTFGVGGGIDYRASPVSNVSIDLVSRLRRFDDSLGRDFSSVNGSVGYGRTLSETASINFGVGLGSVDYEGGTLGDATILSPSVGAVLQTSETGKLSISGGISQVWLDGGLLDDESDTYLSGSVSYCDRAIGGSLCLTAGRSAQPTGTAGVSAVTSLGFGWSGQLSEEGTLSLSARYARADQSTLLPDGLDNSTDLVGVVASYRHRLNDRLSFVVSPSYSDSSSNFVSRDPNLGISAGITLTIGSLN